MIMKMKIHEELNDNWNYLFKDSFLLEFFLDILFEIQWICLR